MKYINYIFKKLLRKDTPYIEYEKPILKAHEYREIHQNAMQYTYPEVEKLENRLGYSIDEEYFQDLALHLQVVKKKSIINYQHGKILYSIMSSYLDYNKDDRIYILETGTARGFSSICLSKALNDRKRNGMIVTLDVIPHNKEMFWNCIDDNEGKKTRAKLISKWKDEVRNIIFLEGNTLRMLNSIHIDRINLSFLDAQHEKNELLNEYYFVKDRQIKGDIIIFDDYTPGIFDGVVKAIQKIKLDNLYNLEIIINTSQRGYVVATRK